ncbi:MAG: 6-phosphofructokinase [Bdellovibrionales bacterium]|nr:6-phosphofructokinase [Bdellovibrionales bacterium]
MDTFNAQNLKRIGVFTSGGDAPGMNAAIRATVRMAIFKNLEVYGITQGYQGMLNNQITPLDLGSMANVIQRGGTILKSGRCLDFLKPEFRTKAVQNLKSHGIDALICIGGDGSFRGAQALWQEHQFPIVGVPGTIDNDINGSEYTIGFDTAVNTALEAIDKIRDTAASHDRLFIVEVMGRNTGYIALEVGLAGGAEEFFFPENPFELERVINKIQKGIDRGKKSSILVTAEGDKPGYAYEIAQQLKNKANFDAKVCILGHIQRGGSPTALDRMIASRFASQAVIKLLDGQCNCMIGLQGTSYETISFAQATQKKPFTYKGLLELVNILSQ